MTRDAMNRPPAKFALEGRELWAGYGAVTALADVSVAVRPGDSVAVLGANGAGKSTLLRVLAGQMRPWQGRVAVGGQPIAADRTWRTAQRGVCYVAEGGGVFSELSVADNLDLARGARPKRSLDEAFDIFPILASRMSQRAASLSGGEKRMLAMSRAVVGKPQLILVDELSLGLAPAVVGSLFDVLRRLRDEGAAVVLVEQQVTAALEFAQWAWVLVKGRTSFSGPAVDLTDSSVLDVAYLGGAYAVTGQADGGARRDRRQLRSADRTARSAS